MASDSLFNMVSSFLKERLSSFLVKDIEDLGNNKYELSDNEKIFSSYHLNEMTNSINACNNLIQKIYDVNGASLDDVMIGGKSLKDLFQKIQEKQVAIKRLYEKKPTSDINELYKDLAKSNVFSYTNVVMGYAKVGYGNSFFDICPAIISENKITVYYRGLEEILKDVKKIDNDSRYVPSVYWNYPKDRIPVNPTPIKVLSANYSEHVLYNNGNEDKKINDDISVDSIWA